MTIAISWQTYRYYISFLLYDFTLFLKRTWANVLCDSDVIKNNIIMTLFNHRIKHIYLLPEASAKLISKPQFNKFNISPQKTIDK